MCIICLEYKKGLLNKEEAKRNVGELIDATLEDIVSKREDRMSEEEFHHLLELADELMGRDPNSDMD
jgi:hypothetical protein